MNKFTASRLSEGNKLFPTTVIITGQDVTLKIPGLFGGKEQTIPFSRISSVDIETPFVGYSTIKIYSDGWDVIIASGFTKADVKQMKEQILNWEKNDYLAPSYTPPSRTSYEEESRGFQWSENLKELKELFDDEVITAEDFEDEKLKLMGDISLDGMKLSEVLRELKDLQEDDVITQGEFDVLKKSLMNN